MKLKTIKKIQKSIDKIKIKWYNIIKLREKGKIQNEN